MKIDLANVNPEELHCECPLNGDACCLCGKFRCEATGDEALRHTAQWRQAFAGVDKSADLRGAALLNLSEGEADNDDDVCAHDGHAIHAGDRYVWHPANPDVVACREHRESVLRF